MDTREKDIEKLKDYKYGFSTDIESIKAPKGLNEDVIKFISNIKKEPQWMLDFRLKAFERFKQLKEPDWQKPKYPKIDYQDLYYYSAPKSMDDKPKSLDELDPKLLETYKKLGIPLQEQARLNGIAVDAVFDSVSVATTFKEELTKQGIIFCPISEAIQNYPELVKKYLGSVIPITDHFFATLNSNFVLFVQNINVHYKIVHVETRWYNKSINYKIFDWNILPPLQVSSGNLGIQDQLITEVCFYIP